MLREEAAGLAPGAQLPSARELVARHRTSPVTVRRAVAMLEREGVVVARPGRGTFVAPRAAPAVEGDRAWQAGALGPRPFDADALEGLLAGPPAGVLALSTAYPEPDLQPTGLLAAALARTARRSASWSATTAEGHPELRAWFARELGAGLQPDDVVVTPGGQAALSVCLRALVPRGEPVLVESPTYPGALAAARAAGLHPVPVPADRDGLRPELLEQSLATHRARLVYCQPTWANPHGTVLARERRGEVLEVARRANAFVLEDDWARDLGVTHDPPPPLFADDPHGHVVLVRSLTKASAPGLRVAALCARGPARARLLALRVVDHFFVAGPLQEAALELLTHPSWARHLRALRPALRARRDALLAALRDHAPELEVTLAPTGGLHVWVRLQAALDDLVLARRLQAAGVFVSAGRQFFAAEPPQAHLRLSHAAARPDVLAEGVRVLGAALAREAGEGPHPPPGAEAPGATAAP